MTQASLPLVLAVDDEQSNVALLERVLRGSCRIFPANSGQAALDALMQAPFDLILLDLMMPDMDGMQTLEHIRSHPKTADIPVILISALSEVKHVVRGLEAGANDYITKPIDMDITRARIQTQLSLKKLQDERKQMIKELQSAQEMKDRLLSMASHDLKGPLMNIQMVSTLLETSIDLIPDGSSLLNSLDSSVETMHSVIKDFLDTAALQTGALDMHPSMVPVDMMIGEVMAEHNVNALRKHIGFEVCDTTGMIRADRARFRQALGNLVSNAVKYSPQNTIVRIWTEQSDSNVTIYVADQGPGIPQGDRGRLFTQFGKLTPRPTGGESSTGLGLWIVKHLVTLQNGQVGLISPPEGGSTFWIKMPVA